MTFTPLRLAWLFAVGSLTVMILLTLAWELWLAPLRPGGSWLVLKALPLLAPLFGVLRGRSRTFVWAGMVVLLYFIEGVMRAWADPGLSARLALAQTVLSVMFILAAAAFVRLPRATAR